MMLSTATSVVSRPFPLALLPRYTGTLAAAQEPSPREDDTGHRPGKYEFIKRVALGVAETASDTMNGSIGIDPTLSGLTALKLTSDAFISTGLIPPAATDLFGKYCYPGFRVAAAPVLDGIKLINTWKMSAAIGHNRDPQTTGAAAVAKSGNWFSVAVDAAHLALDLVVGATLVGVALHVPALALMSPQIAMAAGFAGDVVSGAFHGAGAAAAMSDPANGPHFGERWQKLIDTQGLTAMLHRVFMGEEPLNKPESGGSDSTPKPPPQPLPSPQPPTPAPFR